MLPCVNCIPVQWSESPVQWREEQQQQVALLLLVAGCGEVLGSIYDASEQMLKDKISCVRRPQPVVVVRGPPA